MQSRAAIPKAFTAVMFAVLVGCGSSPSGPGTMNVYLVDGPDATYSEVMLEVAELSINGPTGWVTLATFNPPKAVDLLSLRGVDNQGKPISMTLADGASLPEGHYGQMRMKLGSNNTVTLAGTKDPIPLKVPSGMQSGVKFPVSFDVAAGTTRDVFIDFDAHRSIFIHEAGASGKYLLRPVVRAVDRVVTGSVSGTLTSGGAPLAGVTVMAEVVQSDHPVILRSATTNASGHYTLDLLPVGGSYYVVTQPVVAPSVFPPKASAAIAITEAAPTATFDASFDAVPAAAIGSVSGTITPAITPTDTDKGDTVLVLGAFSGTKLIVRAQSASVTSSGETYVVSNLPLYDGGYTLGVERGTTVGEQTTYTWTANTTPVLATGTSTTAVLNLTATN